MAAICVHRSVPSGGKKYRADTPLTGPEVKGCRREDVGVDTDELAMDLQFRPKWPDHPGHILTYSFGN
ncbi:MAG: hypothetical protein ACU0AZ_14900 [Paracoccaceae bacterium]